MADIDLSDLYGDEFVFHFGGRPNEVDAYTFANSLVAFSEAIREINKQVNPQSQLEIVIDGIGKGSFRAKLRTRVRSLSGLLRGTIATGIVLPLFVNFIYDRYITDDNTKVIINDNSYIIQRGADRIILPRSVYERKQTLPNPRAVEKHIADGFGVLEDDPSVTEFGITKKLDDSHPIASIGKKDFPLLSEYSDVEIIDEGRVRITELREKVIVLRAILERSARKWQFIWNGIKIPAAIKDDSFYDAMARHEYEFGQGDILDVLLKIIQIRDDATGAYLNSDYEVIRVYGRSLGPRQSPLPLK